jgi:hypothetical protein
MIASRNNDGSGTVVSAPAPPDSLRPVTRRFRSAADALCEAANSYTDYGSRSPWQRDKRRGIRAVGRKFWNLQAGRVLDGIV